MEATVHDDSGVAVVALTGDIDFNTSPEARKVLLDLAAKDRDMVVDLSGVSYIDSSGIASLIEAFQAARTNGHRFGLAAVSEPAMRVLRLAQLDKVFPIYETVAAGTGSAA